MTAGLRAPKHHFPGTDRACPPAETLARLEPLLAPLGITRIANVTGLDRIGIPVVMVCRPLSRSLSVFQGKGVELDAARASGVMEAVETFHAEAMTNPLHYASLVEMERTHTVLDVDALPASVDAHFHRERPILWVEGVDLAAQTSVWVPHEVVHADFSTPMVPGSQCFRVTTNGLASGNHPLEAICHGLCEVIERDATTLWNYHDEHARQATEIALETVDDAVCRGLVERCREASLTVRAWDATSDIGVPVYVAELREADRSYGAAWGRPAFGSGCAPTRGIAFARARDEPAIALRSGAPGEPAWRDFSSAVTHASDSFEDDLTWLTGRLSGVGLDRVVTVDLGRADLGLAVTRVIVPGLEGPDEHYEDYVPGPRARALAKAGH